MAKRKRKIRITAKDIVSGNVSAILVMGNMPFVFFLAFLGIVYIANAHYAERKVRDIQILHEEVEKLSWEYMSLKSDLMQQSIESELEKKVAPLGLKELRDSPYKIKVKKEE